MSNRVSSPVDRKLRRQAEKEQRKYAKRAWGILWFGTIAMCVPVAFIPKGWLLTGLAIGINIIGCVTAELVWRRLKP